MLNMKSLGLVALLLLAGIAGAEAQLASTSATNNGTTATVVNKLAIQGGSNTLTVATTSSTTGVVGLVIGGAGTSGSPTVVQNGVGYCVFDGTPTAAGDYVQASTTTGGDCHDAGSTEPTSGDILGRVWNTTSVSGNYPVNMSITPAAASATTAFSAIATGSNTTATMTLGAGGSLTYSSTGVVNANQLGGVAILGGTLTNGDYCTYASSGTLLNCNTAFGSNVTTALGNTLSSAGGVTSTIASGTSALGTGAISSAACATVVTTTATNTATTDVITWGFNGDPTGVTGYTPVTTGALTIFAYPSANNVNFKVCNLTTASITPGAITLNWRVVR